MLTAPSSELIAFVQVVFTARPETSAFQTSSGVNSAQPDDPVNWPPVLPEPPAPVLPEPPVPVVPPPPVGPTFPSPHPTTPITASKANNRMARFYTFYPSSRRRRTSGL